MNKNPNHILKSIFGYDSFRPLQEKIISNVLSRQDTLVIMPTGSGKSLCYQIPALLFDGMTIVVSPLISLMKDQVGQLREVGVSAAFLNSSLAPAEYNRILKNIREEKVKLLYMAPEGLLTPRMFNVLKSQRVDCLTIDEAHCISEWGHDFRPNYRQLIQVREQFPDAVCMALTATATPRVRRDIMKSLNFEENNEFIASFDRENLFLEVAPKDNPSHQTVQFLKEHSDQSGIIYCLSRRHVDELTDYLAAHNFSVLPYHAGLEDAERKRNQELFIRDDVQIIVATIAFGMGINKPNVRFVIHYDLPHNIESYYQQIGRAGRDGLRAHCLLLFSYADQQIIRYFISQKENARERRNASNHLQALISYAETYTCRRKPLLNYFGEEYTTPNCGMCDNCLAEEKAKHDITKAAQKFMSCMKRTREIFGANHIIDVLRGSESKKVIDFGHHRLSTHGIGAEYDKPQWRYLARQFLAQHLITKDPEHGSLKVTKEGEDVLFRNKKVYGHLKQQERSVQVTAEDYDKRLFERLKRKRKQVADNNKVPPFVIFSDKSLAEMATFFPQSRQTFLDISGVGRHKWTHYGHIFLPVIREYCQEHHIPEKRKHSVAKSSSRSSGNRKYLQVGKRAEAGVSIEELAREFGVVKQTIIKHLYQYVSEGHHIPVDSLLNSVSASARQQREVMAAFNRLGRDFLSPVYKALNDKVTYHDLHLLRIYYVCKNKHGR